MNRITLAVLVGALAGAAGWWASQRAGQRPNPDVPIVLRRPYLLNAAQTPNAQSEGGIDPRMVIEPQGDIDPKMVRTMPDVDPKMVIDPTGKRGPEPPEPRPM